MQALAYKRASWGREQKITGEMEIPRCKGKRRRGLDPGGDMARRQDSPAGVQECTDPEIEMKYDGGLSESLLLDYTEIAHARLFELGMEKRRRYTLLKF